MRFVPNPSQLPPEEEEEGSLYVRAGHLRAKTTAFNANEKQFFSGHSRLNRGGRGLFELPRAFSFVNAKPSGLFLMANNVVVRWLQNYANRQRMLGSDRCNDWGGRAVADLSPDVLLDVGCAEGDFLFRYFKTPPREFYGVEGSPPRAAKAKELGLKVFSYDLNGRWPFEDGKFDVVFCSQVIEHLHNTRLFIEEIRRVLKPGGTTIILSENLCSLLNTAALCMGYTPFSLMQVCGRYLGNPLGLHYNEPLPEALPLDHPAFSGVTGHVRVLTVRQARELFEIAGFEVEALSVSILPLPDWLSRGLERWSKNRGHFLLLRARKPA
jgi:SAM-dependent methyltransferase